MLLIIACGSCVRRILQESIRGRKMSSANFVWPVHLARASTLRKGLPTTLSGFPRLPFFVIIVGAGLVPARLFLWPNGQGRALPLHLFETKNTLAWQFHLFAAHPSPRQLN